MNVLTFVCHADTVGFVRVVLHGLKDEGAAQHAVELWIVPFGFTYNIMASLERRMNSEKQIANVGDVRQSAAWSERASAGATNWIV